MKFCSLCGSNAIALQIPEGDNRPRYVCPDCHEIFYQNPNIITGTLPYCTKTNSILLCKRAIEPRYGYWTLPAGFMENGESVVEGAARETVEESGAVAENMTLFSTVSLPDINQVHILYLCTVKNNYIKPGVESLDAQWFLIDEIPWEDLAFVTIKESLKYFVEHCVKKEQHKTVIEISNTLSVLDITLRKNKHHS